MLAGAASVADESSLVADDAIIGSLPAGVILLSI